MAVKDGEIGAAIDGSEQKQGNALQNFFTDPKNLATMLVLGTALAQNRRGQSFGAHLGRAATGALGFRGALDRDIEQRGLEQAEQQSVQQRRKDQTATEQARTAAMERRTDVDIRGQALDVQQGELNRQSSERIAAMQRTEMQPAPMTLDRVYANIRKDVSDAYAAWYAGGQFGPPPDANEIAQRHMWLWKLQQDGVTISFEQDQPPADEETVEPPASPTRTTTTPAPQTTTEAEAAARRNESLVANPLSPGVAERNILSGRTAGTRQTQGLSGKQIKALKTARNEEANYLVENGTEEDIVAFLRENRALLDDKIRKQLARRLRQFAFEDAAPTRDRRIQ